MDSWRFRQPCFTMPLHLAMSSLGNIFVRRQALEDECKKNRWLWAWTDSLAKKWQVENRFSMALPYDAPELIVHIDDYPIYKKIVEEHPEVKYRPGYNPDKYNVMLKW